MAEQAAAGPAAPFNGTMTGMADAAGGEADITDTMTPRSSDPPAGHRGACVHDDPIKVIS
jgi:hypothetical protein